MSETSPENRKTSVRQKVWTELRSVALPDSRFHWNFAEFIPDFEGSSECAQKIRAMDWYRTSKWIFITPDNGLTLLRQFALEDQKQLVVSTYGIVRGFMILRPGAIPLADARLASTLDGMEYFGEPISLDELVHAGSLDLMITGAAVMTETGIRWGKGHGFFDLEWAMFREIGVATNDTPIIAVGHDCQVVTLALEPSPYDTIVDRIVTPTRTIDIPRTHSKPTGIFWDRLSPEVRQQIPPLQLLYERREVQVG